MHTSAVFSPCRTWRYRLDRIWDATLPLAHICGCNPSTADEQIDDATIRREIDFLQRSGFGGLVKTNLFAYRATHVKDLRKAVRPIGPQNNVAIQQARWDCQTSIAAWGAVPWAASRVKYVLFLLESELRLLLCFGFTKGGYPKHTLYLPKSTVLVPYKE